jgi:hypothetical protein
MSANLSNEARAELCGLAIADPERLVDAVLSTLGNKPALIAKLMYAVRSQMPTVRGPAPEGTARIPTEEQRQVIRAAYQHLKAPRAVKHPLLHLTSGDVDVSVPAEGEAAIVGGVLVSLDAVALVVADMRGTDPAMAAANIADVIAEQLAGPVTRASVTRRQSPSSGGIGKFIPRRMPSAQQTVDDPHLAKIYTIQAYWPGAANHPRQHSEKNEAYANRLDGLLMAAAAAGDKSADEAVDKLRQQKAP